MEILSDVKKFRKIDSFNIMGRGLVITTTIDNEKDMPTIGELVFIDDSYYMVSGIELSKILTDPPTISKSIGLLVRKISSLHTLNDLLPINQSRFEPIKVHNVSSKRNYYLHMVMSDNKAVLYDVDFCTTVLEIANYKSWANGWVENPLSGSM